MRSLLADRRYRRTPIPRSEMTANAWTPLATRAVATALNGREHLILVGERYRPGRVQPWLDSRRYRRTPIPRSAILVPHSAITRLLLSRAERSHLVSAL